LPSLDLPIGEFPTVFLGLLLDQPGLFLQIGTPLKWDSFFTYRKDEVARFIDKKGLGIRLGEFNPYLYSRFLAKMAFAYAVAKRGYGNFKPLVQDLILGKTYWFRPWVGGDLLVPPADENVVHVIDCKTEEHFGKAYVVVTLRLFCFLGTPVYRVAVGEENN